MQQASGGGGGSYTPSRVYYNETITIYCEIGFTPDQRNIFFQPAMQLDKGSQQGLEILPPVTWTETRLPQKLPSSYVLIS